MGCAGVEGGTGRGAPALKGPIRLGKKMEDVVHRVQALAQNSLPWDCPGQNPPSSSYC